MNELFASGRVVDLVVLVMLLEAAVLWYWRRQGRGGVATADLWPMLAAGGCLLLALRAALTGAPWPWVGLWLLLALLAHLLDLQRRWQPARAG